MRPLRIKEFSEDWRRPVRQGQDLGLQYWSGPIPGDEVRLFGRWWQVQSVEHLGQPIYELEAM